MKTSVSAENERKTSSRLSKPVMEKRRRDRINQSLETLRLLMLENTQNEKLRNPKVEKAEILESVVDFLKTETNPHTMEPGGQRRYDDGMKSCLLRVRQFIAAKSPQGLTGHGSVTSDLSRPPCAPGDTMKLLSAGSGSAPVWRPWPQ